MVCTRESFPTSHPARDAGKVRTFSHRVSLFTQSVFCLVPQSATVTIVRAGPPEVERTPRDAGAAANSEPLKKKKRQIRCLALILVQMIT